jgi:RNA polymerase sigma factor (sigma-70 family)
MTNEAATVRAGVAHQDDRQLIADCLAGKHESWKILISRYQRLIYSIPLKNRLSPDDAADVFQAVCLKLFERLSTLRDQERLSSWLFTTTTRECWRISARNRRESQTSASIDAGGDDAIQELPSNEILADEAWEDLQRQHAVSQSIEELPERCRDLLKMLFYQPDEPSYADIARRMEMPVSSIGPTRARCLEKLRKLLGGKL